MSDQEKSKVSWFKAFRQHVNSPKGKGSLWGMVISAGLGYFMVFASPGEKLVYQSYDLPFGFKSPTLQTNVVMVYLDDDSHAQLHQKYLQPWNRAFYTQLLRRATAEKAKGVVFDVVFSDSLDPKTDADFTQAMLENGNVVVADDLVASPVGSQGKLRLEFTRIDPGINGGATFLGNDALYAGEDLEVRWYIPMDHSKDANGQEMGSEAWSAMLLLDQSVNETYKKEKYDGRWINYYGPEPLSLPSVSLFRALTTNAYAPAGMFKDKMIFVGEKLETQPAGQRKDEYPSPYSYLPGSKFFTGVGIHATAFLNFLHHDWLRRLDPLWERSMIIAFGVFFGGGLIYCRPVVASLLSFVTMLAIAGTDYYFFIHNHYWFPFLIPVFVQIPAALMWSVAINSVRLHVEKQKVEQSLSLYLPARLVKKFANDPTLLKPGARKQTLTILFSDIAGFTTITEGMDPDELANLMNEYFQTAVDDCIHFTEGTIVKYIGDAIFAFWNAPDPQDDHPYRAAEAALRFRDQDNHLFNGKKVLTRIGLHTGEANVGNFGSTTRVDYTAFGENINLTSRMEGLNKYLGTRVLMTGDTYESIGLRMVTRYVGLFRLKGFEKSVQVYELMDRKENGEKTFDLRQRFEEAREKFCARDFAGSEAAFRRVQELNPNDGPSAFYLEHIEEFQSEPPPPEWKGEIILKDK